MLKINQIYKVKEGHEGKCRAYKNYKGSFIQIIDIFSNTCITYYILNKYKKVVYNYCSCFTEDDLEEEVKQKSLEDLEVGDEEKTNIITTHLHLGTTIIEKDRAIYRVTAKGYFLEGEDDDSFNHWRTIEEINRDFKIVKSLSPSEAETLLEEKLGYKVKIK